jgi:hypothetical protein
VEHRPQEQDLRADDTQEPTGVASLGKSTLTGIVASEVVEGLQL